VHPTTDLAELLLALLEEDVGAGDITSRAVCRGERVAGEVILRERAVVCGLAEAAQLLQLRRVAVRPAVDEGDWTPADSVVLEIEGPAEAVLSVERTALNVLGRMSGVATAARRMVGAARAANPRVVVAGTRKTSPGLRRLDKRALVVGGAEPHRMGLFDALLVKDNHIRVAGGVTEALQRVRHAIARDDVPDMPVEVEVQDIGQLAEAIAAGVAFIMLDNFGVADARRARGCVPDGVKLEISGGITEANVADYAPLADVISCGALTHSARGVNFSLDITRVYDANAPGQIE
jgi:nicotinate-nucleotide pyrophosphorylase (carboxylating)